MIGWLERWQIPLSLAALGAGAVFGLTSPSAALGMELAITPVLVVLL